MNTGKILGKTEFHIEQYRRDDCHIREQGKCYIPMFKYRLGEVEDHWCFSLPIKPMYLMTISDAKKMIFKSIESDQAHEWTAEYKIAEIVNFSEQRTEQLKPVGTEKRKEYFAHPFDLTQKGKLYDAIKEQRDRMLTFLKEITSALEDKSKLSIWEISVLKEAKEIVKSTE